MRWLRETISRLERGATVVHVTVLRTDGSAPRPTGTKMLIAADAVIGSIGGGALEHRASERAQALLTADRGDRLVVRDAGRTELLFERLEARDLTPFCEALRHLEADGAVLLTPLDRPSEAKRVLAWAAAAPELQSALADGTDAAVLARAELGAELAERLIDRRARVWLFGAGHVGRALVRALEPLPFHVTWIDDRAGFLPPATDGMRPLLAEVPAAEVAKAPADALVVVMSHSHALDFAIVEAALARDDLGFVGMIASANKRANCLDRCRRRGISEARLARLTAPLGVPGISGREPAVIAASVAAQLLQVAEAQAAAASAPSTTAGSVA